MCIRDSRKRFCNAVYDHVIVTDYMKTVKFNPFFLDTGKKIEEGAGVNSLLLRSTGRMLFTVPLHIIRHWAIPFYFSYKFKSFSFVNAIT